MKIKIIAIIVGLVLSILTAFTVAIPRPAVVNKGTNIYHIGQVNGTNSIIAVVEFEGRRYLTSTAGGFIEIK
jgi:hypothetical protein